MIPAVDIAKIALVALACAVGVGIVGLGALRLARRAGLLTQVCVVVLAALVSVVAGMIAVAHEMYLSDHDLVVVCWVAAVSGVVSLGVAVVLGRTLVRNAARVRDLARDLGEGRAVHADDLGTAELTQLATELEATSVRLAEARADVARVDASRRELVAWISHDLRTPLAGLRAMAEALEDGLADDPARYHRQMQVQVDHLSDMVDDLFELSKIHSGTLSLSLEPVSLYDLVSDAVAELAPFARSRHVTLRESGRADLTVVGDARELARVVGNLLINAIQHSPDGSEILVSTTLHDDGRAAVSVVDAGGGIPDADLTRVFEAGWRATTARPVAAEPVREAATGSATGPARQRPAGAGLGLAIAQGIVAAHDGGISVRNVPGGCRFDVLLPRSAVPAA
jgi:signal transduction histidine kinase